ARTLPSGSGEGAGGGTWVPPHDPPDWREQEKNRAALRPPEKGLLSGHRLGPAAAARHRGAGQIPRARVAEVRLLRSTPSVGVINAHHGALSFTDFRATTVANQNRLSSHARSSFACLPAAEKRFGIYLKIISLFRESIRCGASA